MRLSAKTDCAIRAVLDLAMHKSDGVIKIREIAKRQGISSDYMGQVVAVLRTAGIIRSKRGIAGGFMLARNYWMGGKSIDVGKPLTVVRGLQLMIFYVLLLNALHMK